ncbi:MAG: exosortase system-associated protein, TIGR04073 family [Planctomycetes bacterium]|nr:exosortase system-associated protein, TIGR04073 family [Planctomycetota bacterium]
MRAFLFGAIFCLAAVPCMAQTSTTTTVDDEPPHLGPTETESVLTKMMTKLGRGIVNIITFIGELPKQMVLTGRDKGFTAAITLGFLKGLGMSVVRFGAGIWEVALFLSPWPDDYKPVLEPEYVWE